MNQNLTIRSIAGYCFETVLWKMILDLSTELLGKNSEDWKVLMPDTVVLKGEDFHIVDDGPIEDVKEFYPPEGIKKLDEAGLVWSLGAMACYASSGHYVFGGRGGFYQAEHPDVELPVLRKDLSNITPLVQRCLCHSPIQRISLKELQDLASEGLEEVKAKKRETKRPMEDKSLQNNVYADDVWPEKMNY